MKTNSTIKNFLVVLTIACSSLTACKKDKNTTPEPPAEVKAVTITELKALSTGASVKVPDNRKVKGIVVTDISAKNIDSKTVILQEATDKPGIILTFDAAQSFAVNDEVEVNISNQTLAQVDGEVVLQNVPAANAKKTGTGTITAKETTIANIIANKAAMNGTLVKIAATELTGENGKFTGTLNVKDASGELTTQIMTGATFSGDNLPPSVSAVTGVVRVSGNATRIDIRKTADVVIGAVSRILVETFDNLTASEFSLSQGNPLNLGQGFSTAFGGWLTNGIIIKYSGVTNNDGAFTTAGKQYSYMYGRNAEGETPNAYDQTYMMTDFTNLQGVKTLKVTFAGSKATKINLDDFDKSWGAGSYNLLNFVEGTDYLQIGVYLKSGSEGPYIINAPDASKLLKISPKYNKLGEWYSFSFTVPTKAELIAAGVNSEEVDRWIAKPNFVFYNYSALRSGAVTDGISYPPIIFDKIEFGF